MRRHLLLSLLIVTIWGCSNVNQSEILVTDASELKKAIDIAQPGDDIILANGEWENLSILFYGIGTKDAPITLRAETPGEVRIQGQSDLKLGGEYLVVNGLIFTNGASPSESVIQFFINSDTLANNCRVTNCVIKDFNKSQKNNSDLWVQFKGRHNQFDHCYLAGKSNRGPTLRVDLAGNESIRNYHKINNNHFGPRPPKGGPSAETIQIGNSSASMSPSHTLVYDNLFDHCNGEVEVISSKSNFNEFRGNVFYKSEGSLVTRHGNYCIVDGNYFIGDEKFPHAGGIRLIGTGHKVTNNYFYNLRGEIFRGPLALMNGIHRPAVNRYFQVTDVVVAYNSWIDCKSPWQIGVGSNTDQKDVLPPSEIRSETPTRTLIANNLIYNSKGDDMPILRYDSIDGVDFYSNVINNQNVEFNGVKGLIEKDFSVQDLGDNVYVPTSEFTDVEPYNGFEFDQIAHDIFGNNRNENNSIGAVGKTNVQDFNLLDVSVYGPEWYDANGFNSDGTVHTASNTDELNEMLQSAQHGDTIKLTGNRYEISRPISVDRPLTITSSNSENKATLIYSGPAETPIFEMNPKGELVLNSVILNGNGKNYAFASMQENMSSLYNLNVKNSEISNFDMVLKTYKHSFSEYISFTSSVIRNCNNGIELSAEDDDKGEYNAENVFIIDCNFENVKKKVIDYYRGGYDESTVGGNLVVKASKFTNCGGAEENSTLINTYGIINVEISGNTFKNNDVKFIARLWGAKNNSESDNNIENSGRIITEQNLPLKLMY